jgi:hypothetical protein
MFRVNSRERLQFVWEEDPAVEPGRARYEETADISHLKFKDGQKPTIFHFDRLTRKEYLKYSSKPMDQSMLSAEEIFARCLKRVDNLETEDGSPFELEFADDGKILSDDCRDRLFSPQLIGAASAFILQHSKLDPSRGQA